MEKTLTAVIECMDHAELLVFDRIVWGKDDEMLSFSIMDSYLSEREYHGLGGRFRRAWRSFWAKPIYYAEIIPSSKERVKEFFSDCLSILECDLGGDSYEKNGATEETKQESTEGILQ